MANDWLKIKVNDGSWGTTGQGPSGTTPVTISASSCDEAIARSATIVFKAGSLTKRLKVTQGIASSPKIQLTVVGDLLITCGQTVTVQLTVSNVDELNSYSWVVTPSGDVNKVTISGQLSGSNVSSSTITIRNNNGTSGNVVLKAQLFSSQSSVLSSDEKRFTLAEGVNRKPSISIIYAGDLMKLHSGSTESFRIEMGNVTLSDVSYFNWQVSLGDLAYPDVTIEPAAATGGSRQVNIDVTNPHYSEHSTHIIAQVWSHFTDGTVSGASASLDVLFCPPDYGFRVQITQVPSSLSYNEHGDFKFMIVEESGLPIPKDGSLTWRLSDVNNVGLSMSNSGTVTTTTTFPITVDVRNARTAWATAVCNLELTAYKDGSFCDSATANITLQPEPKLTLVRPNSISETSQQGSLTFSISGGNDYYSFRSNMAWTAYTDRDDVVVTSMSPTTGEGTQDANTDIVVQITIADNTGNPNPLSDNIRIDHINTNKKAFINISVAENPYIQLDPDESQDIEHFYLPADVQENAAQIHIKTNLSGGLQAIIVDDGGHDVTSQITWVSVSIIYQNNQHYVKFSTLEANTTGDRRPGQGESLLHVVVKSGSIQSDETVKIYQRAAADESYHLIVYKGAGNGEVIYTWEHPEDIPYISIDGSSRSTTRFRMELTKGTQHYTAVYWTVGGVGEMMREAASGWVPATNPYHSDIVGIYLPTNASTTTPNQVPINLSLSEGGQGDLLTFYINQTARTPKSYPDYKVTWHTSQSGSGKWMFNIKIINKGTRTSQQSFYIRGYNQSSGGQPHDVDITIPALAANEKWELAEAYGEEYMWEDTKYNYLSFYYADVQIGEGTAQQDTTPHIPSTDLQAQTIEDFDDRWGNGGGV